MSEGGWFKRMSNSTIGALRSFAQSSSQQVPLADARASLSRGESVEWVDEDEVGESREPQGLGRASQPSSSRAEGSQAQRSLNSGRQQPSAILDSRVPDGTTWSGRTATYALNFMLGSGMVIIQPSSARIVVVFDRESKTWFLPKGRKDIGESLEQAALRETYEESGYRAEFLPLYILSQAPTPPAQHDILPKRNTEPIYMTTQQWRGQRKYQSPENRGGEYLTFWYVGQIPPDAVPEKNTGMADEQHYAAHLLDYATAMQRLSWPESDVVQVAYELWRRDAEIEAHWNAVLEQYEKAQAEKDLKRRARNDASRARGKDRDGADHSADGNGDSIQG